MISYGRDIIRHYKLIEQNKDMPQLAEILSDVHAKLSNMTELERAVFARATDDLDAMTISKQLKAQYPDLARDKVRVILRHIIEVLDNDDRQTQYKRYTQARNKQNKKH